MTPGLEWLLTRATVRIDVGEPKGTGFLVAPGLVVTCAHVVEPALRGSVGEVVVVDAHGDRVGLRGAPRLDAGADLAVLVLDRASAELPVVCLADGVGGGDGLRTFGFPERKAHGEPASFVAEGVTGAPEGWVKFKAGQVRPGMSGGAVLNERTGAVCAVLKRTRDKQWDAGGYGIPVAALADGPLHEAVAPHVARAHRASSPWRDALTPDQRRALTDQAPSAADGGSRELVISVDQAGEGWTVRSCTYTDAGTEPGPAVAVDLNTVRAEVTRLFRAWRSHERLGEKEQARLVGQVLYRSVFPGPIGERFEELVLGSGSGRVDVSLHFDDGTDPELVHLPWEQIHIPAGDGRAVVQLGAQRRLTLTRVLGPTPGPPVAATRDHLAVVVVRAPRPARSHERRSRVPTSVSVGRAGDDLVRRLRAVPTLTVVDLGESSIDHLAEHLAREPCDVLHYVGYGRFEMGEDQLAMAHDDDPDREDGEPDWVSSEDLDDALDPHERLPLLVLQSCGGSGDATPGDLSELAPRLLCGRVDAVVACQFPLPDARVADTFVAELYGAVTAGAPLREAVHRVRQAMRRVPWTHPALFTRRPGDVALVRAAPRDDRPLWGVRAV